MATRKGLNVSGHYVVSINAIALCLSIYVCGRPGSSEVTS